MKHLTLFFLTCWIFWFSQIFAISTICGLSDIPVASVIALGNNVSELVSETLNNNDSEEHSSTILPEIDTNNSSNIPRKTEDLKSSQNDFIVLSEVKTTIEPKNLLQDKISSDEYSDSGGTTTSNKNIKNEKQEEILTTATSGVDEITTTTTTTTTTTINLQDIPQQQVPSSSSPSSSTEETAATSEMNLTIEEKPIPVFSEWAQKQMEEAEKKLEKQVVNSSSSKKNTTNGHKMTSVKLRAKNYASPDCGAKIIASNSEAQNTGALLSSSKDEYMLSPCTNRIWFVIELCEAIQLEKVNLANFELFSSSPKNFSVAVSNRFPTRDWSNVGRFIAEDNRQIQSFDLHPHLFGKFLRVDVHSHYNSEHFCPISLFHVYGTSEFEAFETENRPHHEDLDEYDDDISADPQQQQQQQNNIKVENNLFKSASDAVISIVKKAAQVLVKTNSNETENENDINNLRKDSKICFSPKINFICGKCNQTFVQNVNELLSCKFIELLNLLNIKAIKESIIKSSACPRIINRLMTTCNSNYGENYEKRLTSNLFKDKQNILLNILPGRYLVSLCHLINTINLKNDSKLLTDKDTPLNLTLDKKFNTEFIKTEKQLKNNEKQKLSKLHDKTDEHLQQTKPNDGGNTKITTSIVDTTENQDNKNVANENNYVPTEIPESPTFNERQVNPIELIEPTENVNIFNIVDKDSEDITTQHDRKIENDKKNEEETISTTSTSTSSSSSIKSGEEDVGKSKENENEQGSWESLDKLFSEQTSSENLNSNSNNDGGTTSEFQATQRVQSESIFIRLSNRIKALERNMSLSGQYLEELSRRYKKQVEELQYSFTKTLSAIEEQNRNANERENLLSKQYKILEDSVTELTIHFKSLIICLLPLLLFQFIVSWFFIRSYRRRYLELIKRYEKNSSLIKRPSSQQKKSKKLSRRRSIEGVIVNQQTTKPIKIRRPSEEAMKICGSYKDLLILDDDEIKITDNLKDTSSEQSNNGKNKQRQRKLSIFYGKIKDNNHQKINNQNLIKYERLESVSENFNNLSTTSTLNSSFKDDELIPDEDYESYVPGSDLAYNEFMPDGPSGNGSKKMNSNNIGSFKTKKSGKIRKLSSPRFLKSPFSKYDGKKLSHGPTGWEWYRSKKPDNNFAVSAAADKTPSPVNGGGNISTERVESINGIALSTTSSSKGSDESMRVSDISSTTTTTTNGGSFLKNSNGKSKKRSSFRKILKKVF